MKPKTTLEEVKKPSTCNDEVVKETFKPPFKMNGLFLFIVDQHCASNRKSNKAASKIKKFIEIAVGKEWERRYGEPQRWTLKIEEGEAFISCPRCPRELIVCFVITLEKLSIEKIIGNRWNYCPSCGVSLLPPKEGE
jgi:hypothetical protein